MEIILRLSIALGVFGIMLSWESLFPRRKLSLARLLRWRVNISLAVLNAVIMRFSLGGLAYLAAIETQIQGYGILNLIDLPIWLVFTLSLLSLDFAIYLQHVISHKCKILWNLHQVHHTDLDIDATTAIRFHPIEIKLSMLYKTLWIIVLGADPLAVLTFEIILNAAATFNHSNIYLAPKLDQILRRLIVTPDMHRIHHSTIKSETDSNYGFSISIWDRIFKTYTAQPSQPQTTMTCGLEQFRQPQEINFLQSLILPFKKLSSKPPQ